MATFYDPVTGGNYTTGAGGRTTGGSAASGGGINPATGKYEGGATQDNAVAAPTITPYSLMSLSDAKAQADKAFSGMVSPMTLEDIRKRETAAQELTAKTAENVYNPQIKGSEALGRGQISTVKGAVGQGSGFNLSTAESTYLNNTQGEVQARTKELVDAKATYIANGNFDAADRADAQIQQLNEYNNQLTMAKANYALSLMSGDRETASLMLETQQAAFNQTATLKGLELDVANLVGEYQGKPTLAAQNAAIQNALAEAGLTGIYQGKETLENRIQNAQIALQKEGIQIDRERLAETIRSNKVQESLAYARLKNDNSSKAEETPSGIMNATIERLKTLRDTGLLTDLGYEAEIANLAVGFGENANIDNIKSFVNKAMEGSQVSANDITAISSGSNADTIKKSKQWYERNPLVNVADALVVKGVYEGSKSIGSVFFGL